MSKPARASSRLIARPMRLPPPVTSAAPRSAEGLVNPAEFDEVDDAENGDEAEDDVEGQHGTLLVPPGNRARLANLQDEPAVQFAKGGYRRPMNPMLLSMIAVVIAGGATALQAPTNAKMMTAVGSPVNAAFVSFAVGTAALGILAMVLQARPDMVAARNLPWYAWIGGLYGAVFVVAAAWGVPRLGVALTITLMVAGQLLIGLILDHFGAFGSPQSPISLGRLAGVALVIGGVLMVRRF